jgi:hypothetical protein
MLNIKQIELKFTLGILDAGALTDTYFGLPGSARWNSETEANKMSLHSDYTRCVLAVDTTEMPQRITRRVS